VSCHIIVQFSLAYVNHFKVDCVVAIHGLGCYFLGNIRGDTGIVNLSTGADVERISVWVCL
jgi:hypothetical protein